ncbi:MAG TPA: hypothetical protein VHY20_12670, partial [Pirellulales bacterium]|nr:hypothetical protein [Pirellulales bacterium]
MSALITCCYALVLLGGSAEAADGIAVDVSAMEPGAEVQVDLSRRGLVSVEWPAGGGTQGRATFRLATDQPLIESLSLRAKGDAQPRIIARDLTPFTAITVGTRNLDTPGGWTIFFDKVHQRPYERYAAQLKLASVRASARGSRGSIAFNRLTAGPFAGELVFSFYAGSPLILAEAVVSTTEDRRAIIYDAGLIAAPGAIQRYVWADYDDAEKSRDAARAATAGPHAVRYRTVVAEMTEGGALALFPPPHRFFYPLESATNFGFNWLGRDYRSAPAGDGWGIRQPPEGDRRFVPWVNAPPGTSQHLGAFYLLSAEGASAAIDAAKRFTHGDRYVTLPGRKTFTSHYHIEHTLELLKQQAAAGTSEIPAALQLP